MIKTVADLCDDAIPSPGRVHVCEANYFKPYGLHSSFHGKIRTCRIFESNPLVRSILSTPGGGDVLVVDGGMSMRTALMGDQIAKLAVENGWAGVIINGCIRDSAIINTLPLGVKARGTVPVKSLKGHAGEQGVAVAFAGVEFVEGWHVYADEDGVIVSEEELSLEEEE